jgi:serine protease Do
MISNKMKLITLAATLTIMPVFFSCQQNVAISKEEKKVPQAYETMKFGDPLPANLFVELAKHVNPAVVSISTSVRPRRQMQGPNRDPFFEFFEQFGNPYGSRRGAPQDNTPRPQGIGSGFIIDSEGLIVTNNHVIEGADVLKVALISNPEKYFDAKVIGADPRTDIALIKIESSQKFPSVTLGSSETVEVGEWVAAFGNPYGHTFSMSKGIISAKSRAIRDLNAVPFLQTDAGINPGNSGGPLVNTRGEVIGVNAAIDARAQGIGFAIPIDHVKSILPQLKSTGRVAYGFLGVEMDNITPRAQQALGLKESSGAIIMGIVENSPAAKAGVQVYDVVTEFNSKSIKDVQDLQDAVQESQIGKTVPATVLRNGKKVTLNVTIGNRPDEQARVQRQQPKSQKQGDSAPFNLGFKTSDWNENIAKDLGVPAGSPKGPIITEVDPNSPAGRNGLRPGDVVLDVNRTTVKSAKDVARLLKEGNNVLRVIQNGRVSLVFIEI